MKKIVIRLLLMMIILLSLTACGSRKPEEEARTEDEGIIRVAVIYSGNLGDKSYNDSCSEGARQAEIDFGVELTSFEGIEEKEREEIFLAVCEEGYDLVICTSSDFEIYMKEHCEDYPDVRFAVIDTTVEGDNIQSVRFAQNQGSFLAGAAAAMFTECTEIEGVNEDAVIGWVGGMDIPVLRDFYVGYEQGAKYINPDITVLQAFADAWDDPSRGKELALAQYDKGADIVMNVASSTGIGILEAAKDAGKYAIGVNVDQDNEQPGAVLTSMVKRVDTACYLTIQEVVEGTFKGGTTSYLTIEDGGVTLTDFSVMKEYLGDQFPQEIEDKIAELEEMIISGELIVDNYEGFDPR